LALSCCARAPCRRRPERVERFGTACLGRAQPSLEHQVGEIAILVETAEDRPDLPDHQLEHRDFLVEQREDLLFKRAAGDKVEHVDLAPLTDAVDASNALFNCHRIPR
jgi:hypothetical protein